MKRKKKKDPDWLNPSRVNFRYIASDVLVGPWQKVVGAGITLKELKKFLITSSQWDIEKLEDDPTDINIMKYGDKGEFWVPNKLNSIKDDRPEYITITSEEYDQLIEDQKALRLIDGKDQNEF